MNYGHNITRLGLFRVNCVVNMTFWFTCSQSLENTRHTTLKTLRLTQDHIGQHYMASEREEKEEEEKENNVSQLHLQFLRRHMRNS